MERGGEVRGGTMAAMFRSLFAGNSNGFRIPSHSFRVPFLTCMQFIVPEHSFLAILLDLLDNNLNDTNRSISLEILHMWFEFYWKGDFLENPRSMNLLYAFSKTNTFLRIPQKKVLEVTSPTKQTHIPKSIDSIKLLDAETFPLFKPAEFARQLTIAEHENYCTLTKQDFMSVCYKPKRNSSRIVAHANRHDRMITFFVSLLLQPQSNKIRASLIEHMIAIMMELIELHNYWSLYAFYAVLIDSSIARLKLTWKLIGKKSMERYDFIHNLMSSDRSFREYRRALAEAEPPCVPMISVMMVDLKFIMSGNADELKPSVYNFQKWRLISNVIVEGLAHQRLSYKLHRIPEIQALFHSTFLSEKGVERETSQYERSLELEPKVMRT
eukprot:TRINITY_DN5718_c0_g1_i2.p1 TRINITY_DN5718_c0_g1~~TRINITY_DN5718_c0_g1_i2.p1  ORF type:complete len:383 (-),score=74.23 TRINITY_DN5718_c0_g1_i2:222-1370(-)